ncbi:MAG: hypothetical protein ACP6IY_01475 [Promethearchaeia archaeon]
MPSILFWIDGITGSLVVILGILFGIFFYYEGYKKNAKLLKKLCYVSAFAGLLYLGVLVDFISLLFTGKNFPNEFGQVALLSYIWFPLVMVVAINLASQIQFEEKTKYFMIPYIILGIIFYILIFIDPLGSFYFGFYENESIKLIDYNINMTSIAGIFLLIMLAPVIIAFAGGLIYHAMKTTGVLRKKFLIMALGAFFYGVFGSLEGFTQPGVMVIIVRIGYLSSFWIIYYGLKP